MIITPELVRPIPAGGKLPELKYPKPFLPTDSGIPVSQPGMDKTGPVPVKPPSDTHSGGTAEAAQRRPVRPHPPRPYALFQMVPVTPAPAAPVNPGLTPSRHAPASGSGGTVSGDGPCIR